jgi:mannose-6-phosphate isomerase-like protein (cupin superfamily)
MKKAYELVTGALAMLCLSALFVVTVPSVRYFAHAAESPDGSRESAAEMLRAFVEDFRRDPLAARPVTFGIRVDEDEWQVEVGGWPPEAEEAEVILSRGFPDEPTFFFFTDAETLGRIYRGELAALTAMGKASSRDASPLDVDGMEGAEPTPELVEHMMSLCFHFWTRGVPEIVRFGDKSYTRELHGANTVLFYYRQGFRSAWFQIEPGQHVNEDPKGQANPFPSMLIITKGAVDSRIGGAERQLVEGEMVLIGAGVTHEFWNSGTRPSEGILLMFGEGA